MKRMIALLIGIVVALQSTLMASAPLADVVPEDGLVYVGWAGASTLREPYAKSNLAVVLKESRFAELFTTYADAVQEKMGASRDGDLNQAAMIMSVVRSVLADAWEYPTAFYLRAPDWESANPMPRAAVIVKAGKDVTAVRRKLDPLVKNADGWRLSGQGEYVVISFGYPQDKLALALAGEGKSKPITTSAEFEKGMAQAVKSPAVAVFIDVEGIYRNLEKGLIAAEQADVWQRVESVVKESGLSGVKSISYAAGFDGANWASGSFVHAPGPRTGLLAAIDGTIDASILQVVPAEASTVLTAKLDAKKLLSAIVEGTRRVEPEAGDVLDDLVRDANQVLGADLIDDLAGSLGSDWVMYTAPGVTGDSLLAMVVVNKLPDPARAKTLFQQASKRAFESVAREMRGNREGVTLAGQVARFDDIEVYYMGLPIVAPAWAIEGDHLYFGFYPQSVAAAIKWTRAKKPDFSTSEKLKRFRSMVGREDATGMFYVDLPHALQSGGTHSTAMLLVRYAGFADLFGMPLPEPIVPTLDTLLKVAFPSGGVHWTDEDGFHSRNISPFPGSMLLSDAGAASTVGVGGAALGTSILLPSLNRAREAANRVKCASQLRQMGMAMVMYVNDNNGAMPPDLATLLESAELPPQLVLCPSVGRTVPNTWSDMTVEQRGEWINANSNYRYLPTAKLPTKRSSEIVVMYELPDNHRDGGNVLFADGHVEFLPSFQLERALKRAGEQP
jgi:prepilin-type processing-associated H-X9-DG protein